MDKINNTDISKLALQQSEDNKKEIINIYSKLKNTSGGNSQEQFDSLSSAVEQNTNSITNLQTQVEQNTTDIADLKNSGGSNQSSEVYNGVQSSQIIMDKYHLYLTDCFKVWPSDFCFRIYSPYNQTVYWTADFTLNTASGTHDSSYNLYVNNHCILSGTGTNTTYNITISFDEFPIFLKQGYNQIKLEVNDAITTKYHYLATITSYFYGKDLSFEDDNFYYLDIVYGGENKNYFVGRLNKLKYRALEVDNSATSLYNSSQTAVYEKQINGACVNFVPLFSYNSDTNKYERTTNVVTNNVPQTAFQATKVEDSSSVSIAGSIKLAVIVPTLDTNYLYKGFVLTNYNKFCKVVYTNQNLNTDITDILSVYINPADVLNIYPVKIIDDLFLPNRELTFCCHTKSGENFLVYNVESDNPQVINLGVGGNLNLYFHNNNIFYFITKEGKTYVNFLKYNSETNSFTLLNNQVCLGAYSQVFASNYDNWFFRNGFLNLKKLDITPFYNFE